MSWLTTVLSSQWFQVLAPIASAFLVYRFPQIPAVAGYLLSFLQAAPVDPKNK